MTPHRAVALAVLLSCSWLVTLGCSDDDSKKTASGALDCADVERQFQDLSATLNCTDTSAQARSWCEDTFCREEIHAYLRCSLAVPAAEWICHGDDGIDIPEDRCQTEESTLMACESQG